MRDITPTEQKILRSSKWLKTRTRDFQECLLALGGVVSLSPNQVLWRRGKVCKHVYGLIEGQIDVIMYSSNDDERVSPNRTPGRWLPISDTITKGVPISDAIVRMPTLALRISRSELVGFLDEKPARYREIMTHDNEARKVLQTAFTNSLATTGEARAAVQLLGLYESEWLLPGKPVTMPQEDMAAVMGVSVPTLQRVLRKLKKEQIVGTQYGKWIVFDVEKLRNFSKSLSRSAV